MRKNEKIETGNISQTEYRYIKYHQLSNAIVLLVIARPERLNRLNRATIIELMGALAHAQRDETVRAIILTGSGTEAFCAGWEEAELQHLSAAAAKQYAEIGQALMQQLQVSAKPVIAAINGLALGAGLELALAATLRLSVETAKLGHNAVVAGYLPAFGATQRLARLIGQGRALEFLLTGDLVAALQCYQWGLINQLCNATELITSAYGLAQRISTSSPLAIKYCLEAVINGQEMPLEDGLFLEATLFGLCITTEDTQTRIEKGEQLSLFPDHNTSLFEIDKR